MSTARGAKLKAQYNRVRTSTALRANDMWTNTIGMEQDPQAGSNAAIEAAIYAPTHGGAGNRAQRRELAQQLIQATGYQPSVTDYKGLLKLANEQGSLGVGSRGACKLCGGMGHLTKQCTNFLTGHNALGGVEVGPSAAGPSSGMGLLPDPDAINLSDFSSSDSDSGSDSDSDRSRERHKSSSSKKRKRSSSKKDKSKKDKKERMEKKDRKDRKHSSKKSKKSKRSKHSGSDSD